MTRIVEGVSLKHGQIGWQTERLPIHGCRIVDNTGRVVAADVYDEELAEQIVAEHNQHAALVAEWERLRAALVTAADQAERASFVQDRSVHIIRQACALIASDLDQLLRFAKTYSRLGWAIQEQVDDVVNGSYDDLNPNALQEIKSRLKGFDNELDEAIDNAIAATTTSSKPEMRRSKKFS